MSEAPERIWANQFGVWNDYKINPKYAPPQTEYIRADHANELIAAAYEAAASILRGETPIDAHPDSHIAWLHQDLAKTVLNLTPDDARAALEARDKRVREEALREAGHLMPRYFGVWSATGVHIGVWDDGATAAKILGEHPGGAARDLVDAAAILALITKDATNG